jgi:hypothetical protein
MSQKHKLRHRFKTVRGPHTKADLGNLNYAYCRADDAGATT